MADEEIRREPLLIGSGSHMVFRKSGTVVRVSEAGIVADDQGDEKEKAEALKIFESLGHWVGIHIPLMDAGFEWLGVDLFEDMALDLLEDSYSEATQAKGHLRRFDEMGDEFGRIGHRLAALPHIRKAVLLAAAGAEAYINEFIAKHLADRAEAIDRIPTPSKWSVAVELATGKRLEEATDELPDLKELFTLRNRVMHFHPSMRRISFEEREGAQRGGVIWRLENEWDPMRFASLVARCIIAVHKITGSEDVERLNEIVDRAIDKGLMDEAKDVATKVDAVIGSMTEDEKLALKEAMSRWQEENADRGGESEIN